MRKSFFTVLFLLIFFPFFSLAQNNVPEFPGTREGAQELLTYIIQATHKQRVELTKSMVPSLEDCEAVFDDRVAKKVFRYERKLNRQIKIIIRPLLKDQTDLLLWSATTEEMVDYVGEAKYFPGGYKELAQYLRPNQTVYRFKFIQPGRYLGSAYDMMVYVNGNWKMIHRPWAVLFKW
ncbi:MAG: hypothetical protein KDD99_21940 [Bacteroidetes bacterium]|nr:hypothetical protein [Bacteroidota bacterium]